MKRELSTHQGKRLLIQSLESKESLRQIARPGIDFMKCFTNDFQKSVYQFIENKALNLS